MRGSSGRFGFESRFSPVGLLQFALTVRSRHDGLATACRDHLRAGHAGAVHASEELRKASTFKPAIGMSGLGWVRLAYHSGASCAPRPILIMLCSISPQTLVDALVDFDAETGSRAIHALSQL